MPDCTIGLDIGTTSAKAIAFANDATVLGVGSGPIATRHGPQGEAEQDPALVTAAALLALRDAATTAATRGYRVARIGISAAMHSIIPLDEHDAPLMPALIWMDNRAAATAEALWSTPAGQALYLRTGTPIHAMSPLAKILWLRDAEPAIFAQTRRWVSLKEWVWRQLGGDWQIDASIASATGMYNLLTGEWDAEALHLAGITAAALSAIVPTSATRPLGAAAQGMGIGLDTATHLTIGASDGTLANLGVGAIADNIAALTIGTSAALRVASPVPSTDRATRRFCYVLADQRYIVGAPSNSGGVVLEWLGQQLSATGDLTTLVAAAAERQGGEIVFLPYLAGERAPLWDPQATATISGMRIHHTAADLMRAAIEGVLMNVRWLGDALPATPTHIVATGRVLEQSWLRQIVADLFQVRVAYDGNTDASVVGAARLADLAAGARQWSDIRPQADATITQPREDSPYPAFYQRFRTLAMALHGRDPLEQTSQSSTRADDRSR